jgi:hypothetical protein
MELLDIFNSSGAGGASLPDGKLFYWEAANDPNNPSGLIFTLKDAATGQTAATVVPHVVEAMILYPDWGFNVLTPADLLTLGGYTESWAYSNVTSFPCQAQLPTMSAGGVDRFITTANTFSIAMPGEGMHDSDYTVELNVIVGGRLFTRSIFCAGNTGG